MDVVQRRSILRQEIERLGREFRNVVAEFDAQQPWRDPLDPEAVVMVRKTLGYTQVEFARACGFSRGMSVSELERGNNKATGPTRRVIIMLFERFGSDVEARRRRDGKL